LTESVKVRRFKAIVLPHLDTAYRLARWLVHNDHDAEDVVQEAFLSAFRSFDSFHGESGKAWLLTIVRHACYRWLKQRQGQPAEVFDETLHSLDEVSLPVDQPANDPESWLLRDESQRLVRQALEKLPLEFREIIVLRELEGYSYHDIASLAAIPMGTVMSRLARARGLLWKILMQLRSET
jgi:RNA polymerase sigma factor (sigma-70 family)